jgi:hypothetical protein
MGQPLSGDALGSGRKGWAALVVAGSPGRVPVTDSLIPELPRIIAGKLNPVKLSIHSQRFML